MKNNEKQEETAAAAAADEQLKITSEDLIGKQHPNQRVRKSTRSTRYKAKGGGGAGGAAANGAGGSTGTAGANGGTGNGGAAAGNGNNGTTGGGGSKTAPKGRSRRNMFKKIPTKTPSVTATTKCVESLFHNVGLGIYRILISNLIIVIISRVHTFKSGTSFRWST